MRCYSYFQIINLSFSLYVSLSLFKLKYEDDTVGGWEEMWGRACWASKTYFRDMAIRTHRVFNVSICTHIYTPIYIFICGYEFFFFFFGLNDTDFSEWLDIYGLSKPNAKVRFWLKKILNITIIFSRHWLFQKKHRTIQRLSVISKS